MKLKIKNIGKVKNAEIELNGITVIGGENNTGKSTIGKTLYSIFNSFYEIQQQIEKERLLGIENILQLIYRGYFFLDSSETKDIEEYAREILEDSEKYINDPDLLKTNLLSNFNLKGSLKSLYIGNLNIDDIKDSIIANLKITDSAIFNSVINKKFNSEFLGQLLDETSKNTGHISLCVKNESLNLDVVDNVIKTDNFNYSLHTEAIYIDDPFILDKIDVNQGIKVPFKPQISYLDHRAMLVEKLLRTNETGVVEKIVVENMLENIYAKLGTVCSGNIVKQKNGKIGYQMNGKALNFANLSTGLKTFVIIKSLLTSGVISSNGTIILDEPEIHLHPEWQLIFAEIIVLLNKEFGINILLTTHSPYFLRAIQVYSVKYNVSETCKYYLSENDENDKAEVMDVTDNVEKIFAKLVSPLQKLDDERWNID